MYSSCIVVVYVLHDVYHFFNGIGLTFRYLPSVDPPMFIASICQSERRAPYTLGRLIPGPLILDWDGACADADNEWDGVFGKFALGPINFIDGIL